MVTQVKIELANKKRQHRGYLSVRYNELDQSSYRSIDVKNIVTGELLSFKTGDFIIDYLMYKLYYESSLVSTLSGISYSSSYDHFLMDGDCFKEDYVEFDDEGENGRIISTEELFMMPMHEWDTKFSKYIFRTDMDSFQDLIDYWTKWKSENEEFYENWEKEVDLI
jgi:hypothetical protein